MTNITICPCAVCVQVLSNQNAPRAKATIQRPSKINFATPTTKSGSAVTSSPTPQTVACPCAARQRLGGLGHRLRAHRRTRRSLHRHDAARVRQRGAPAKGPHVLRCEYQSRLAPTPLEWLLTFALFFSLCVQVKTRCGGYHLYFRSADHRDTDQGLPRPAGILRGRSSVRQGACRRGAFQNWWQLVSSYDRARPILARLQVRSYTDTSAAARRLSSLDWTSQSHAPASASAFALQCE